MTDRTKRMTFRVHVGAVAIAGIEDEMTELELVLLEESLRRGLEDIKAGRYRPAAEVLAELRRVR